MKKTGIVSAAAFAVLTLAGASQAAEPAAIVEAVSAPSTSLKPMDFLDEGQVIQLNSDESLTLGYLSSCTRETIKGGKVTIGAAKSAVESGLRKSEEVDCDGARVVKVTTRATDVAGAVFRKGKWDEPLPKADWTSFSTSPLVRLTPEASKIRVERIDKQESAMEVAVSDGFADFAREKVTLKPSGLYEISAGNVSLILQVSPLAEKDAPLLSRIVPM
ncbi:MAG: hypothetical protein AB7U38_07140 [Hyphomicrobiales bacterium]